MSNANDFVIENGVLKKYVGPGRDVVIPEGVTEIGVEAFYMRRYLLSVVIPDTVKAIGSGAFRDCVELKRIVIPDSVTKIGEWAFYGCKELKEITIPQCVAGLWDKVVFIDCPLEAFHGPLIPLEEYHYKSPSKNALAVGYAEMTESGISFTEEVAQGYIKQIKAQKKRLYPLMLKRPLLLRYMLNNKVIPVKDMQECLDLANAQNEPEIAAMLLAYQNVTYTREDHTKAEAQEERKALHMPTEAELQKKQWTTKKTPDGSLMISAYKGDDVEITVPEVIGKGKVTALEKEVFSAEKQGRPAARKTFFAQKLEKVQIPDSVSDIPVKAFRSCEALKAVNIPINATRVGMEAFKCCRALTEIRIPGAVSCVDEQAFAYCSKLRNVVLEDGVTSIEKEAFTFTTQLESIRIPNSVQHIAEDAFYFANKLTIHAPAGSYAETYAKENNIPFVVE